MLNKNFKYRFKFFITEVVNEILISGFLFIRKYEVVINNDALAPFNKESNVGIYLLRPTFEMITDNVCIRCKNLITKLKHKRNTDVNLRTASNECAEVKHTLM